MLAYKLKSFLKPDSVRLTRTLWGYVAVAFNKVDTERLKLVGPDRLCAEWVLKNGGAVKFVQAPNRLARDYNSLPADNVKMQIKEIDATDSSIMQIGMDHLIGCKCIDRIVLHNCKHLEADGLEGLVHVKPTLIDLQVSGCYNISDEGLLGLKKLTNLKSLKIFDMKYVNEIEKVASELKRHLPNCNLDIKP